MAQEALFGRYWEAESPLHRLDPRVKVAGSLLLVITTFCAWNFFALGLLAVAMVALFALARIPFTQALRSIAPLSFIIVLTALFNLFCVQGGNVLFAWGPFTISEEGVRRIYLFVMALLPLISLFNCITNLLAL